jgi:hypothetical protein
VASRPDVGCLEHCVEGVGEFGVAVADEKPELLDAVAEVHQEVPGLLCDPCSGWVGGDSCDVYASGAVFDDDERVEAAEEDGVDVGEVDIARIAWACAVRNCVQVGQTECHDRRSCPSRQPPGARGVRHVEPTTRSAPVTSFSAPTRSRTSSDERPFV